MMPKVCPPSPSTLNPKLLTLMTSSMSLVSSTPGMKPAPMPWILCGPGLPPDSTGDSAGSTATNCTGEGEEEEEGMRGPGSPLDSRLHCHQL